MVKPLCGRWLFVEDLRGVYIDAEPKDRHSDGQLGLSAGRAPITPAIIVDQKLSTDFDELRDVFDAAVASSFFTDHFAEDVTDAKLFLLKPGESIVTATIPPRTVKLDLGIEVRDGEPPEDAIEECVVGLRRDAVEHDDFATS